MQSMLPIVLLFLTDLTAGYLLPNPSGRYNVTLATGPLIDYTRDDIWATPLTPRELMLSIFQPATCASTEPVPYMPRKTAEYQGPYLEKQFNVSNDYSALFLKAQLPVCPNDAGTCSHLDDGPILLLSPGWGVPRLYYSVLASAIASEGFTVITIDHPSDANIITYPDGHAVYLNASTYQHLAKEERIRAADASFVIDQLSNATAIAELLPQRGPKPFMTDRIGMLGHSLGGASSIVAASQDPRIRAAINWDGTIFPHSSPWPGVTQPVLLMQDAVTPTDPTWTAQWSVLQGPKLWVKVGKTTHQTFSDIPTLLQAAGEENTPALAELLGTIAPAEMVRTLAAYTTAWMHGAFEGKEGGALLEGKEHDKFPEVSILKQGNF